MLLRPRQELFVERSIAALNSAGNTLGVAPTGAGKTVMLSAVAGQMARSFEGCTPVLVLQHRDELVEQNAQTYHSINPSASIGVVNAKRKDFGRDAVFAMVQTLMGDKNLEAMRPPGMLVIDEAHHSAANSYRKILDRVLELNPTAKILGVTATPNRGDGKALREIFDNVSDQITLTELINAGHLVKPRTFVLDLGVRAELETVRKQLNDFDMRQVESIMDKRPLNERVVEEWKELASDRQTVAFCSTVAHAEHIKEAFIEGGIATAIVEGNTPDGERKSILSGFDQGRIQVLVNVAVLTEGWDCPPTSCIVLLRPSSYKSTMIQMVGRGLRTIDPEKYPGVVKTDCIVLDFGTSTLTHGSLEQDVQLDGKPKGNAPNKVCPGCGATVPAAALECGICNHVFVVENVESRGASGEPSEPLSEFAMTEVDLFESSPFKWEDLWGDDSVLVASAFEAWAMAIFYAGTWHAIGGAKGQGISHLAVGERLLAIAAADDFMRGSGDTESAAKSRRWLHATPTDRQLQILQTDRMNAIGMTRYKAACHLTWKFNERGVRAKLQRVGVAA